MNMNMNMKSKRTRLIVEFKEFQRLPDWPIIKLNDSGRPSESAGEKHVILPPARGQAESSTRTLAE
jgi:hypothetical protein